MIANTIKYRFEKQGKFGLLIQTWMLACTLASIVSTMRDGKLGSLVPITGRAYHSAAAWGSFVTSELGSFSA
jgi:hypothetical protein